MPPPLWELRENGYALFKHAVHVSFVGQNVDRKARLDELKEYFDALPENVLAENHPVRMKFIPEAADGSTIIFLQHGLGHVPTWPYHVSPPIPPTDTVFISNREGIDRFFGNIKKIATQKGYGPIKVEEAFVQYVKPHRYGGIQAPLFPYMTEMSEAKVRPPVLSAEYTVNPPARPPEGKQLRLIE